MSKDKVVYVVLGSWSKQIFNIFAKREDAIKWIEEHGKKEYDYYVWKVE